MLGVRVLAPHESSISSLLTSNSLEHARPWRSQRNPDTITDAPSLPPCTGSQADFKLAASILAGIVNEGGGRGEEGLDGLAVMPLDLEDAGDTGVLAQPAGSKSAASGVGGVALGQGMADEDGGDMMELGTEDDEDPVQIQDSGDDDSRADVGDLYDSEQGQDDDVELGQDVGDENEQRMLTYTSSMQELVGLGGGWSRRPHMSDGYTWGRQSLPACTHTRTHMRRGVDPLKTGRCLFLDFNITTPLADLMQSQEEQKQEQPTPTQTGDVAQQI